MKNIILNNSRKGSIKLYTTKGISLIVLVITIVIIVILAGAIILNLVGDNNIFNKAREAEFKNDITVLKDELTLYKTDKYTKNMGIYNPIELQADKTSVIESKTNDTSRNITNILKDINKKEYIDKFEIANGELIYIGNNEEELYWSNEIDVITREMTINISTIPDGNKISGVANITGIVADESKVEKWEIYISEDISNFTEENKQTYTDKTLSQRYEFNNLEFNKEYYIKAVITINNKSYVKITNKMVVDKLAPDEEQMILTSTPSTWTNTNIIVTATYPSDAIKKEYKVLKQDNSVVTDWTSYTAPITVTENGQVDIRGEDAAGNISGTKTLVINKIDKEKPVITLNGGEIIALSINQNYTELGVVVTDNLDKDIQNKLVTTGTVNTSVTGEYVIRYNVTDLANNSAIEVTRKVVVISLTNSFVYKGSDEYWTVPVNGRYKIELYGAQGGLQSYGYRGGLGGYTSGEYVFTKEQSVRIRVGGVGGYGSYYASPGSGGWPDGQSGQRDVNYSSYGNAGGGGKSDISINGNILIAAGGGRRWKCISRW